MPVRHRREPVADRKRAGVEAGSRARAVKTPGHAQALSRGLAILEALAATDAGATLTTLASTLDLPAPTAHRLLATLEAAGLRKPASAGGVENSQ